MRKRVDGATGGAVGALWSWAQTAQLMGKRLHMKYDCSNSIVFFQIVSHINAQRPSLGSSGCVAIGGLTFVVI